jgi:M6 family metalloprotease-like protein
VKRGLVFFLALALVAAFVPTGVLSTTPPRDGGPMPQWYYDGLRADRNFLQFENAWIKKVRDIKKVRERFIHERGFYNRELLSISQVQQMSVAGTFYVPVLCAKFNNTSANPFPTSSLQTKLFDGPVGPGTFVPHSVYPVGDAPRSVFAADLDRDGDVDLTTANYSTSDVSVLLNHGDGTFAPHSVYPVGLLANSVVAADLDGDGDVDLATANEASDNVSVLLNYGNATFAPHLVYSAGDGPYSVVAADLDADSDLDLATANRSHGYVSVLLNNGDGSFAPHSVYSVGERSYSVFAADLDGDYDNDLVTANIFVDSVSVLLNNGDATFSPYSGYSVGHFPCSVFAADLDGDSDLDLATANLSNAELSVLLNIGDGTFSPHSVYTTGAGAVSVFAADLDDDNDLDLATANGDDDNVSVLLNNGNATFAPHSVYEAGDKPFSVFAADLDGDSYLDLVTANLDSDNVSVIMNQAQDPQTLADFYTEVSYGNIALTGTVFGWYQVSQNDTYYEGPSGCNGFPSCGGQVGQYLTETLTLADSTVDFGLYDNDGPDNIPNSGDDDGYVDFVAFVHPEVGAECGSMAINFWSHRWTLSSAAGSAFTTGDARSGGGFIQINDYVLQSIYNCDGTTLNDIGVFAHEFGHAFGLPDLYDRSFISNGIGNWGLMGTGCWNLPPTPAHLCTWSKMALGWLNIVNIGTSLSPYVIDNIEQNTTAYRLDINDERWRRMTPCAIDGSYSMRCGLLASEGAVRNWPAGDGHGDMWREGVSRDFNYDGAGSVTLQYDYSYDSETDYDYTYARIDVGGTVSTLATYHGTGSGAATIDLTPYLSGPSDYMVSLEFESDFAWSDRDSLNPTTCGPFVFDNVSVTGGGETHFTDFEQREDGWCADMTTPAEFFYVENRQPVGSDVALYGGGGLVIWHVNEDVAYTGSVGNTGGSEGALPRGVMPEQADGMNHLESKSNRGDGGDPFPGSTSKTTFDNVSTPNSRSYTGLTNNVMVTNIGANPADGSPMTADMSAGWPAPTVASCAPDSGDNDQSYNVVVMGTGIVKGAGVVLDDGANTIVGTNVEWVGKDMVTVDFDLNGAVPGDYDLVLTNPGDGTFAKVDGFTVRGTATAVLAELPKKYALYQNYPNPFNPTTSIRFDVKERVHTTLKIYNVRGQVVRTLVDGVREAKSHRVTWNGRNDAGHAVSSGVYFYKLVAGEFTDVRKLTLMK